MLPNLLPAASILSDHAETGIYNFVSCNRLQPLLSPDQH